MEEDVNSIAENNIEGCNLSLNIDRVRNVNVPIIVGIRKGELIGCQCG